MLTHKTFFPNQKFSLQICIAKIHSKIRKLDLFRSIQTMLLSLSIIISSNIYTRIQKGIFDPSGEKRSIPLINADRSFAYLPAAINPVYSTCDLECMHPWVRIVPIYATGCTRPARTVPSRFTSSSRLSLRC